MRLRSLTTHLKNQNWFAVVLDLFIVVIGVFIGIQVSNWNERLADDVRADAFIVRLHENIAVDLQAIKKRHDFNLQVINYGDQALAYAESSEAERVADWPTILAFFQASQIFPYYQNNTTYAELRSSGELSLIEEQSLRKMLADYYVTGTGGITEDFVLRHVPDYRSTIRGLMPSFITKHVWAECHDDAGVDEQSLLPCELPLSEEKAKVILDSFMADPTLLKELRFWMSTLDTIQGLLANNEVVAKELLQKTATKINQY